MKSELNLSNWSRREHFEFFKTFDDPFFGVIVSLDCTALYDSAKANGHSFFLYYLHKTLIAANSVEAFRLRIEDDKVFCYDTIHASPTLTRPDGTFSFGLIEHETDLNIFLSKAQAEISRAGNTTGLFTRDFGNDIIHFSAIPWIDFTSLSHARKFSIGDSSPKISFGKMTSNCEKKSIAVSIHVHHGLADAIHVSHFIDRLQLLFLESEKIK